MTEPNAVTTWTYDILGRVTSKRQQPPSNKLATSQT
jgi:hypothetical protein